MNPRIKILIAAIALSLAAISLTRRPDSPQALACHRLSKEIIAAKAKIPTPENGGGLQHIETYAADLRALNLKDVPAEIQTALQLYIRTVDAFAETLRRKENYAQEEKEWWEAGVKLHRLIEIHTTKPH